MTPEVRCLPVAGTGNPYQSLMMKGLAKNGLLKVEHGVEGAFFAAIRTCFSFKPDYLHYDWINSYARKRNRPLSYLNLPLFMLDLMLVRYLYPDTQIVWTLHNIYPHSTPVEAWHKYIRLFFYRQTKWVRVFSDDTIDRFMSFYGTKDNRFITVPEGSYKSVYPAPLIETGERSEAGDNTPQGGFRLLHIGRLYPYKGLEQLISAFKEWPGNHTLTLAGKPLNDTYAFTIQELIGADSRISFHPGFVPEAELPTYFANADIAVLPFVNVENSGSVILAMGYSKPVLAPAIGVLTDRLSNQSQLLYKVTDGVKEGLENLSGLTAKQLETWGRANCKALDRHEWSDFQKLFLVPDK